MSAYSSRTLSSLTLARILFNRRQEMYKTLEPISPAAPAATDSP